LSIKILYSYNNFNLYAEILLITANMGIILSNSIGKYRRYTMKNLLTIILISAMLFAACENENITEPGNDIEETPSI